MSVDEIHIEQLYNEYAGVLRKVCQKKTQGDHACTQLIEEAIQDTFLAAYQSYDIFQKHPNKEAWLIKTCLNRLMPKLKAERARRRLIDRSLDDSTAMPIIDPDHDIDKFIKKLDAAAFQSTLLSMLQPLEEAVFRLYFLEDNTMLQIADALALSENQVKVLIRHIRKKAKYLKCKNEKKIF